MCYRAAASVPLGRKQAGSNCPLPDHLLQSRAMKKFAMNFWAARSTFMDPTDFSPLK